jgi:hypothetical protein
LQQFLKPLAQRHPANSTFLIMQIQIMGRFKLLVLFVFAAFTLQAQSQADLVGTWKVVKVDINRDIQSADLIQDAEQLQPALAVSTLELGADGQCKFVSSAAATPYTIESGKWRFDEKRRFIILTRPDVPGWGALVLRVLDGATTAEASLQILESALRLDVKKG